MLLGLSGASHVFYSSLLPVPLGLGGVVLIPLAGGAFGIGWALSTLGAATIVASVGVWQGRRWGRIWAAVVTGASFAYEVWYQAQVLSWGSGGLEALAWLLIGLALPAGGSAFILFVLVRRWVASSGRPRASLPDPRD